MCRHARRLVLFPSAVRQVARVSCCKNNLWRTQRAISRNPASLLTEEPKRWQMDKSGRFFGMIHRWVGVRGKQSLAALNINGSWCGQSICAQRWPTRLVRATARASWTATPTTAEPLRLVGVNKMKTPWLVSFPMINICTVSRKWGNKPFDSVRDRRSCCICLSWYFPILKQPKTFKYCMCKIFMFMSLRSGAVITDGLAIGSLASNSDWTANNWWTIDLFWSTPET